MDRLESRNRGIDAFLASTVACCVGLGAACSPSPTADEPFPGATTLHSKDVDDTSGAGPQEELQVDPSFLDSLDEAVSEIAERGLVERTFEWPTPEGSVKVDTATFAPLSAKDAVVSRAPDGTTIAESVADQYQIAGRNLEQGVWVSAVVTKETLRGRLLAGGTDFAFEIPRDSAALAEQGAWIQTLSGIGQSRSCGADDPKGGSKVGPDGIGRSASGLHGQHPIRILKVAIDAGALVTDRIPTGGGSTRDAVVRLTSELCAWASVPYLRDFGIVLECSRITLRNRDDRYNAGFEFGTQSAADRASDAFMDELRLEWSRRVNNDQIDAECAFIVLTQRDFFHNGRAQLDTLCDPVEAVGYVKMTSLHQPVLTDAVTLAHELGHIASARHTAERLDERYDPNTGITTWDIPIMWNSPPPNNVTRLQQTLQWTESVANDIHSFTDGVPHHETMPIDFNRDPHRPPGLIIPFWLSPLTEAAPRTDIVTPLITDYFYVVVPENTDALRVWAEGGQTPSGILPEYRIQLRRGALPRIYHRAAGEGISATVSISPRIEELHVVEPGAGVWYGVVRPAQIEQNLWFTGVTANLSFTEFPRINIGRASWITEQFADTSLLFDLEIPAGSEDLQMTMRGGRYDVSQGAYVGDADLSLSKGGQSFATAPDSSPGPAGVNLHEETISIDPAVIPLAGSWRVRVDAETDVESVRLESLYVHNLTPTMSGDMVSNIASTHLAGARFFKAIRPSGLSANAQLQVTVHYAPSAYQTLDSIRVYFDRRRPPEGNGYLYPYQGDEPLASQLLAPGDTANFTDSGELEYWIVLDGIYGPKQYQGMSIQASWTP